MKLRTFGFLALVLVGLLFSSCAAHPRRVAIGGPAPAGAAELKITQSIIPPGNCGRPLHRSMRPTFITIHSTDNTSRSADALHHALAMNKGLRGRRNRTGFLTWHFTVDDHSIYQSLPTNETGEHADYEGEGNRSSIGIEMCVTPGEQPAPPPTNGMLSGILVRPSRETHWDGKQSRHLVLLWLFQNQLRFLLIGIVSIGRIPFQIGETFSQLFPANKIQKQ